MDVTMGLGAGAFCAAAGVAVPSRTAATMNSVVRLASPYAVNKLNAAGVRRPLHRRARGHRVRGAAMRRRGAALAIAAVVAQTGVPRLRHGEGEAQASAAARLLGLRGVAR